MASNYDPTKKELYAALNKRSSGVDVSDPLIEELWATIKSEDNPNSWLLLNVASNNIAQIFASGNGLSALVAALTDDDMLFGVIRCTVKGSIKFYQIYFVGANVSGIKRGKSSLYKNSIFNLFETHGQIQCSDGVAQTTCDDVISKIMQLTSSAASEIVI